MDNYLVSNARQIFVVTRWDSRYRILFDPLQHRDAHRPANIFKNLNGVIRRSLIAIEFGVAIRKLVLRLDAHLVEVVLRRQSIDSPSRLVMAFEGV